MAAIAILAVGFCAVFAADASAQEKKKLLEKPRKVSFRTKDGITLVGTYFESNAGREAPVVVLLHGEGGSRLEWKNGLGGSLQRAGYAVITVDLRRHGQSKSATDQQTPTRQSRDGKRTNRSLFKPSVYQNMVALDMEAVKKFIYEEHQAGRLNMNKTGIVGAGMGAAVAVSFAWNDWLKTPHPDGVPPTPRGQDIRALVLLTPKKVNGLPYAKPLNTLKDPELGVAFLIGVGKKDRRDEATAERIFSLANMSGKNRDRVYLKIYAGGLHGAGILSRKELKAEAQIMKFFGRHLKRLPSTWRNRQSKIVRS